MAKFSELVAKQKEAEGTKAKPEFSFRGSGLTKKLASKSVAAYNREAKQAETPESKLAAAKATEKFNESVAADIENMRGAETNKELVYDQSQENALQGLLAQRFGVLIGAAGTGKTTLLKRLLAELEETVGTVKLSETQFVTRITKDDAGKEVRERVLESEQDKIDNSDEVLSIAFAAYTGRASQQMKRNLPKTYQRTCSTIHSLLGYAPVDEDYEDPETGEYKIRRIFRPSFNALCKLPFKVYIFDEGGMIPIPLWNEFIDACPADARIYMIGDINQLPPVHGKGVLGYAMSRWPVYELTTIHRQAADNPIIANAHNILNGRFPVAAEKQFDIIGSRFVPDSGSGAVAALNKVVETLSAKGQFDPLVDAIIVPQNKDVTGQLLLNERFVTMFNHERREGGVIINKRINIHTGTEHKLFATGDKVMLLANDNQRNLTNGMIGVIESIHLNGQYDDKRAQVALAGEQSEETISLESIKMENFTLELTQTSVKEEKKSMDQRQASHVVTVKFADGGEAKFSTSGEYRKLAHAYAFTCHKAQGGEYPTVIILVHSANAVMLTREWLYTAVTRARERVVIVGNDLGLQKAIARQSIKGVTLAEKIKSYQVASDIVFEADADITDRHKFPILPEAEEV